MLGYIGEKKITFAQSVLNLIGHLIGSAILFISVFIIAWILSYVIHWFDSIHKLPEKTSTYIAQLEHWLVVGDSVLCLIVMIVGAYRFMRDLGDTR
jgi:hypothetical protein